MKIYKNKTAQKHPHTFFSDESGFVHFVYGVLQQQATVDAIRNR